MQRITEDLEYTDLLRKALHSHSSTERLMYVAVFAVSGYSNTLYRESKPFNPLLGETFEWQSADGDTRFLCEQVCSAHMIAKDFRHAPAAGKVLGA